MAGHVRGPCDVGPEGQKVCHVAHLCGARHIGLERRGRQVWQWRAGQADVHVDVFRHAIDQHGVDGVEVAEVVDLGGHVCEDLFLFRVGRERRARMVEVQHELVHGQAVVQRRGRRGRGRYGVNVRHDLVGKLDALEFLGAGNAVARALAREHKLGEQVKVKGLSRGGRRRVVGLFAVVRLALFQENQHRHGHRGLVAHQQARGFLALESVADHAKQGEKLADIDQLQYLDEDAVDFLLHLCRQPEVAQEVVHVVYGDGAQVGAGQDVQVPPHVRFGLFQSELPCRERERHAVVAVTGRHAHVVCQGADNRLVVVSARQRRGGCAERHSRRR